MYPIFLSDGVHGVSNLSALREARIPAGTSTAMCGMNWFVAKRALDLSAGLTPVRFFALIKYSSASWFIREFTLLCSSSKRTASLRVNKITRFRELCEGRPALNSFRPAAKSVTAFVSSLYEVCGRYIQN